MVREDDKKNNVSLYQHLANACRFKSPHYFPLPPLDIDNGDVIGYLVLLSTPYFLREDDAIDAVPLASMSLHGWHLFTAAIQQAETRANLIDELALRVVR